MAEGRWVVYCTQCGGPLGEGNKFCGFCGAALSPPLQQAEEVPKHTAAPQGSGSADSTQRRGGGEYGCSIFTMGALIVGFFVLIGVANGLDEGAGWAVVVFGLPILVLSAVFLVSWHWAIGEMDRRNKAEAYRQQREEYLRELQIRDHQRRGQG